ncbi:MAG: fatty acid desaturase [Chitinophagaceae bacterium]|nr:fatty acid desaturase [Chitinophagaceae bacterium]
MKNNLENISFDKVISQDGISYVTFRKNLKPSYKKAFIDIAKGYVFLLLIFTVAIILIDKGVFVASVAIPLCAFLVGYTLAYLHLFIHAAAHYNLHPDKKKNDQISDYAIGFFFGIQQKKYRKIHWMHHTNLGRKNDTEHSYFNELNTSFLLKCITGIHAFAVIVSRKKNREKRSERNQSSLSFGLFTILFHGLLIACLFLAGGWQLLIIWLAGLLIFFPAFAAIRQLLEHRDVHASGKVDYQETDHGKVSRLFGKGIIDSTLGAAGFNRHLIHHWDPTISYTALPLVEEYLLKCAETSNVIKESKTSYIKTFLALFKI